MDLIAQITEPTGLATDSTTERPVSSVVAVVEGELVTL
jgi:hypothetical protein